MSIVKKIITVFSLIVALFFAYCLVVVIIAMATKYKPAPVEDIAIYGSDFSEGIQENIPYSIITYNIGYGGLDASQDFFMAGGKNSGAASLADVQRNTQAFYDFFKQQEADFVFIQEIDESGKRSFNVNQVEKMNQLHYSTTLAYNYRIQYLPIPFLNPMGGAKSGIFTMSKAMPIDSTRHTFDGKPNFFVNLFELDRCFMVNRFAVEGGQELVLINAHFSVFDKGGTIREKQLAQMKTFLEEEYQKGNYVILGGDFNHELPGTSFYDYTDGSKVKYPAWAMPIPESFAPEGFVWGVDVNHPTCRSNDIPLQEGDNALVVLDGFLVSDNITIESVATQFEMGFLHSDHNPVRLNFVLKSDH